jgi:pimeloyl-ACP methyl ester carboxylesterase
VKPALTWLLRWLRLPLVAAGTVLGTLVGCQSKLIYYPRPYHPPDLAEWKSRATHRMVAYETSAGKQTAYLQAPKGTDSRQLWLVCVGNGSLALDWADWLAEHGPPEDAYLLFDYPGYGQNEGAPNPARIRESLKAALPLAVKEIGWSDTAIPDKVRFFGHSLGAASCLMAATEFKLSRGVLLAPFTSTMDMTKVMLGVNLGFIVYHRFDNLKSLEILAKSANQPKIMVFHGAKDVNIPLEMSQRLQAAQPGMIEFHPVPEAEHNDIHLEAPQAMAKAMREL